MTASGMRADRQLYRIAGRVVDGTEMRLNVREGWGERVASYLVKVKGVSLPVRVWERMPREKGTTSPWVRRRHGERVVVTGRMVDVEGRSDKVLLV